MLLHIFNKYFLCWNYFIIVVNLLILQYKNLLSEPALETVLFRASVLTNELWLMDTEVHFCIHMCFPIIPILRRLNLVPRSVTYFFKTHLLMGLFKGLFPVGLLVEILKAFLPSSVLSTWYAHLNLLDLITLTTLGERYKLWSSSMWSFLRSLL